MKKTISIILITTVILVLSAFPISALQPPESFNSLEEYQEFVKETELPENFVYYESVSMFGDFDGSQLSNVFSNVPPLNLSVYEYFLTVKTMCSNEDSKNLFLTVADSFYFKGLLDATPIEIDTNDLTVAVKSDGYTQYKLNNLTYIYSSDGGLHIICWKNEGLWFFLNPRLDKNTYLSSSLVGKLLDKSTAPEVIEILTTDNFTEKPDYLPETSDPSLIFAVVSLISAGGFALFLSKRTMKKSSNKI